MKKHVLSTNSHETLQMCIPGSTVRDMKNTRCNRLQKMLNINGDPRCKANIRREKFKREIEREIERDSLIWPNKPEMLEWMWDWSKKNSHQKVPSSKFTVNK